MKKNTYKSMFKQMRSVVLICGLLLFTSLGWSQNLLYHYAFDDDVSETLGNGADATLGATASFAPGFEGTASGLSLDGSAESYAILPQGIVSTLGNNSRISFWVYARTVSTWSRLIDFGSGTAVNLFITPNSGSGTLRVALKTINSNGEIMVEDASALATEQWVFLQLDFIDGSMILSVDGVEVARNDNLVYYPKDMGKTTQNYIGDSQYSADPIFDGIIDELKIYDNIPQDLRDAYANIDIPEDLSNVTGNLTLATDLGNGVTATWTSSMPEVIAADGTYNDSTYQFDQIITLTAEVILAPDTLVKDFTATVIANDPASQLLASWLFPDDNIAVNGDTVTIESDSDLGGLELPETYTSTLINEARVRKIGTTNQYNVIDLPDGGKGYLDLSEEIGKYLYQVSNYTMSIFFRANHDADLSQYGRFIWTFSNTDSMAENSIGGLYMIVNEETTNYRITPTLYSSDQGVDAAGAKYTKGEWHHLAYVQNGTTGTLYLDGTELNSNENITYVPSNTLKQDGREGTIFNWLGRASYASDNYLTGTQLYGFQFFSIPFTGDDIAGIANGNLFGNDVTIDNLNAAFAEDSDVVDTDVSSVYDELDLGDLSAVTENITLPTSNPTYPAVTITWESNFPELIAADGTVVRPDMYDYSATLTATISKGLSKMTKSFPATVLYNEGTEYTGGDLLVHHDFSNITDGYLTTDNSAQAYQAKLENDARFRVIGQEGASPVFTVLDLGGTDSTGTGYLDLGEDMGVVLSHIKDYTMSAYYRIDTSYHQIGTNGNFLWNHSNTDDVAANPNGYLIGILNSQGVSATSTDWSTKQELTTGTAAPNDGNWHHLCYVQKDTAGYVYVDGVLAASSKIIAPLDSILSEPGYFGTPYNWIGRSPYAGDVYLRNTYVYDYRVYTTAISETGILYDTLNVEQTLIDLFNASMIESDSLIPVDSTNIPNAIETTALNSYDVYTVNNSIAIKGAANKAVAVYAITGRKVYDGLYNQPIELPTGIYIVNIDGYVEKVIIK